MSDQEPDFAALGAAAAVLSLLGKTDRQRLLGKMREESDEKKRLKAVAADTLEVFGLKREPSVSLGALIARDIRIAQAKVGEVEWHVAVLTGEAAQELDVIGVAAIDRAYTDVTKGRLLLDAARLTGCPLVLQADGVPAAALRALSKALREEIDAKTPQA